MKKVKLRTKVFRISFIILFAIFITVFISNKYGYYEYRKHEQVTLTQEQIMEIEQLKTHKNYVEEIRKGD